MELSQGDIIQKAKMQELSSLFLTHRLNVMRTPVKFHEYISHGLGVGSYGPDKVNYMELSQGDIIQKAKMQELLSLFMTHRLNVMHASVKFHVYIPYGYGVIARTRLTIWNLIKGNNQKPKLHELSSLIMTRHLYIAHAPIKFHEYIPYDFGSNGPDTVYYMELCQGQIIHKPKMQELSSLFMTHCLNVMHAPVKFHEYIPYALGVMAQTRFTIWN